ncbi:centromere protein F [Corvus cornix cornix]|uniref:centromere protein F n=1 Tax=Corvus cornix cornix TaxID=932674 RepID=UPI001950920D|nr:centromere protein F [Corvus cornix cornix]XP_020439808.2 centromere protein F [Corvus cornix cornix]
MSWAVEEWKEGLSPRVLQKIHELESQVDKLKKERQQRQYQLETLEAALQKQKQKVENEKNESAILKRENQSLMELCDNLEKAKQKISHDLQVKESQVNIQSGQLNSSKKDIERLEQELKRCKCELERSQQTLTAGDVSFSGTPQKSFTSPLTPVRSYNDAKFEELEEKYKKKVQENKELELQLRAIQLKKINQPHPQSSLSHREIARHQASSSVFSWQQEKTPARNQETPARGSSAASSFPWDKEANSSIISEKSEFDISFAENCNSSLMIQLRAQNQELNSIIEDLEQQLQAQEKMKRSHMNKYQETELELDRLKLQLTEKDKILNKTRDKLTQTSTQLDQATTQVQMLEQKVKRLSEELNCQRQNAESARQSLEQKIKAKEKEYQQELSCQQRSLQTLDQQCNQIRSKLNQELQQAKNDFNVLQAEFDKVMAVKQRLEHDTSDLTQKLCRAEQALTAAQAKEADLTRNFEEVKQEKNLLNCQLEKKSQEIHQLEEELNMIKQSPMQSQNFAEEMKNKNAVQEVELKLLEEKFKRQESSLSLENLKITLADMEKQQESTRGLLKEKDNHIKEQDSKISKMEGQSEALQKLLGLKQRECEELQKEATVFSQWKNETDHLIYKLKSEKEGMLAHINDLESSLQSQQSKNHEHGEKLRMMQTENDRKSTEIRELKDMLECKSAELEEQKKAFDELKQKAECSDKKYCKEIENMSCKIFQLTNKVAEVEEKLQLAASQGLQREQCYRDLLGEYEKICCLVKVKDTSEVTEDGEVNLQSSQDKTPLDNMQLAATNFNTEDHRCARALLEVRKTKDLANLQEQISFLESSLAAQKQLNSNQQQQYEELLQIKSETEQRLFAVEQKHKSFMTETKQHISNLQADISAHQELVEKTSAILEEKDMQLQTLNERLENRQAELQDLKINNKLLEESLRQLKLMSETWDSEKKDMSSMVCSYSKKIGELTEENAALRDLSSALKQEQVTLLEANKNIYDSLKEREEIISEVSGKHEEERQRIESRTEEIKTELEVLQEKYKLVEEENGKVMSILREQTIEFEEKKAKLEQEKQVLSENKDILHKLIVSEEIKKGLVQELQQLQSEFSNIQHVPSIELDCVSQERLNVRTTQNTVQEKCGLVPQEKELLGKELPTENESLICDVNCEQRLCSEQFRKSMEEKDIELNKCQVKLELLQMDFEDSELSLENCRLEVMQLETALKGVEAELEKSMREKERLQQELLSVKEQKSADSSLTALEDDGHSLECNYGDISQDCGKRRIDESPSSVLLASSLQVTINQLSELEKMCERLQSENTALASGFKDANTNGTTGINKEEKDNIMNADSNLKAEKAVLPDELMDQSDNSDVRMCSDNKEMPFRLKECNTSDYEDLKLSSKEVKIHFTEVRERLLTFQNEHLKLYEQHCSMSSKICELQSCIEVLKAENSSLSTSLSSAHVDSLRVSLSSSQGDMLSKLDDTKATDSSSDLSVKPCLIEVSKVVDSRNRGTCKWTEEMNQPDSSVEVISEDATEILVENLDSVRELRSITPRKSNLESRIEKLQMLCQTYEKAIKVLEDQFHVQENMKNEEIQELKEVILSERKEIDLLKQQNLSEKEEWQQKLNNVTMEMECKLAAERKQTENLSLELEAARLQLQVLDLSSHSLLCTDNENNIEQGNSSFKLGVPVENSGLKNNNLKIIPIEEMAAGDASVCENETETAEARLMEDYTENISGEHECRNMSGKISSPSDHASAWSFSNSRGLSAGYFCENQITTEMLQEEAKQQTAENLKLIYEIEKNPNHVGLKIKVEQLNLEMNFQEAQITSNSSAFAKLEEATVAVKEENHDIKENYATVSVNKQDLSLQVVSLEKEPENLKSVLEICKVRSSNAADTLNDVEMAKRDCQEQFHAAENEWGSPKSEQVNIENHALFIEHEIEMLQAKCQQLEREREVNLKTISSFQEHLVSVTAERNCIGQELSILSESKKDMDQKHQKLQEQLKELELAKMDSTEFIRRLEDEVRTQAHLLEAAKSDANQLSNEKDHLLQKLQSLGNDAVSFTLEKEKLQNEAADSKKEKELIAKELETMQHKLSSSEMENSKLSKSLEGLLMEKGELAARLSAAQKEADQLRCGIEKLKVKIESDEKKKRHIAEKLRDNERKTDSLQDKIERLERELEMSEKNLEDTIIELESAKAEAETLAAEMEDMTEKLKCSNLQIDVLTSQKECLAKDLKEMQERFLELESSNLTTAKQLEEKEEEKIQIKDEFENTVVLLKSELKDMSKKLEFSCKEEADARVKEQVLINQVAHLEQDKIMVLQECQEIKNESIRLDQAREVLVQELMDCKQKLDEKVQENCALEKQVKETEALSLQLTHMQRELECWHQEKERLQNLIAELKLKERHFSDGETSLDILNVLKMSYKDLEKELESTLCEKNTLCKKVNELAESQTELQVKLDNTEQKITRLQEERNKLAEEMQCVQEHSEKNKIQLQLTTSENNELTRSLEMVQHQLQEKESEIKRQISEYKDRLLQAEKEHQDALTEANRKNEVEFEACHEKISSLEHFVRSQKLEIERLKSNNEQLNNSLKEANQALGELLKTKADNSNVIIQLKKENEYAHSKVQMWMKSCKQLEQEKEMLQKQLAEHDELLKKENLTVAKHNKEDADDNASTEEIKLKLEELQESTELKTREANENLEKYCSLIVKYHKLEEANEMLKTQVSLLSTQLKQQTSDAVSTPLLNSDKSLTVSKQSVRERRSDGDTTKLSSKRQRCEDSRKDNGEPRSPAPETSSKKKRKCDISQNLCQENTDCELDGLPEIVQKGFADIPTGKVSPYILRRTTLHLRSSPNLPSSSEKRPLPTQDSQKCRPDHLGECCCSTPGGSKPQKENGEQQSQAFPLMNSTSRSPLCLHKQPPKPLSDNTRESCMMHKAKNSLNEQGLSEQDEQKENCKVQ